MEYQNQREMNQEDPDLKQELDWLNEIITENLGNIDPTDSNLDRCYREFCFYGAPEEVLAIAPTKGPKLIVLWEEVLKELEQFEPSLRTEIAQKHDPSQVSLYSKKHMQEIADLASTVMTIRGCRTDIVKILENLKMNDSDDQSFGTLGSCDIREVLAGFLSTLSRYEISFDIQKLQTLNSEIEEFLKDVDNSEFWK